MDEQYLQVITTIKNKYSLDFVALAFIQPAKMEYVLKWQYAVGNLNERFKRIALQSGKGIAGLVFKLGKPMHIQNIHTQCLAEDLFNFPIIVSEKLKSFCALPLYKKNKVQGVILLGFRTEDKMTTELFDTIKANIEGDFPHYYGKEMAKR